MGLQEANNKTMRISFLGVMLVPKTAVITHGDSDAELVFAITKHTPPEVDRHTNCSSKVANLTRRKIEKRTA